MDCTDAFSTQTDTALDPKRRESFLLTNVSYSTEDRGHRAEMPVMTVSARDEAGTARTFDIEGFRPSFGIRLWELHDRLSDVLNDRRVLTVACDCSPTYWYDTIDADIPVNATAAHVAEHLSNTYRATVEHRDDARTTMSGDPVATVYVTTPDDIAGDDGLRNAFDETFEADVPFTRRFLIDTGIYRGFSAPDTDDRLRYENHAGESRGPLERDIESCDPPDIDPRLLVFDIEVATEGDGFPEPHRADHPITAITAYDSGDDTYALFALESDEWDRSRAEVTEAVKRDLRSRDGFPDDCDNDDPDTELAHVFDDETKLLEAFHTWSLSRNPDIFTGWSSDNFDVPYVIQRSYRVQAGKIRNWGHTSKPAVWTDTYDGETQTNYTFPDVSTLDLLDAYRKTQYTELDSYRLDAVASAELGYGKLEYAGSDLDDAWHNNPVEFFAYNVRDTQATVNIEAEADLLGLYENLRDVTGAPWVTANNNGPMIDTLFLRQARADNICLPTNTEPDEDVYHGAKVFDPIPGIHEKAVYPDLSSMYPNLFWMLNLGQETIIGDGDALSESQYDESDCYTFPVDNRPFATVPKGESIDHVDRDEYKGVKTPAGGTREMFEPQYDWLYVLKPEHEESFVRSTVDDLIELKYNYSGDLYEAVKRVTNSVYGTMGDSNSAGVGFRLYDRRIAEGITMAGRLVIQHTADTFTEYLRTEYDDDAVLVGGDTDSAVSSIPNAPDFETALTWAHDAVEHVDASYDGFVQETFGFGPDDEHRLAVELENLSSKLFFMAKDSDDTYRQTDDGWLVLDDTNEAVKKRYAEAEVWNDSDGWIDTDYSDDDLDPLTDPADRSAVKHQSQLTYDAFDDGPLDHIDDPADTISVSGFELVRSDSAQITRDVQRRVLTDILFARSPLDEIEPYLSRVVADVTAGEYELSTLARPKGISQQLDEYGWRDAADIPESDRDETVEEYGGRYRQRPGPTYRGAKYADDHFDWESLGAGSKPLKIPIEQVRSAEYPAAYTYDTYPSDGYPESPEINDPVDALAVEFPDRVPAGFVVDHETIVEKALKKPIAPIVETLGTSWDDALAETEQTGLDAFA